MYLLFQGEIRCNASYFPEMEVFDFLTQKTSKSLWCLIRGQRQGLDFVTCVGPLILPHEEGPLALIQ